MKKKVLAQPCEKPLELNENHGYHRSNGSRNVSNSRGKMSDDLETTLRTQEELGSDISKGAVVALKIANKTIIKLQNNFDALSTSFKNYMQNNDERWAKLDKRHEILAANMAKLQGLVEAYHSDASKYKLIVDIVKFFFGSPKRVVASLVTIAVLLGYAKLDQITNIIKMLLG